MNIIIDAFAFLWLPLSAYFIGAASPGPANFAIMGASMESGRRAGFMFAMGVLTGSVIWGVLAAAGLGAILQTYSHALNILKFFGGVYLFLLAFRAARTALVSKTASSTEIKTRTMGRRAYFFRGLRLHLTNPKPILTWTAVIALGLSPDASRTVAILIVVSCAMIGFAILTTYALLFSTQGAIRAYGAARRWINCVLAICFGAAGAKMIVSAV